MVKPNGKDPMSNKDSDMLTSNFNFGSEGELDMINIVMLPIEYDIITEVTKEEDDYLAKVITSHKPLCYYIMNSGCMEEENASFERSDEGMRQHLKPLFVRAKVEKVYVDKVLVDRGAKMNLMSDFLLMRIGKFDTDLRPRNMVLSNYEGKTSYSLGVI